MAKFKISEQNYLSIVYALPEFSNGMLTCALHSSPSNFDNFLIFGLFRSIFPNERGIFSSRIASPLRVWWKKRRATISASNCNIAAGQWLLFRVGAVILTETCTWLDCWAGRTSPWAHTSITAPRPQIRNVQQRSQRKWLTWELGYL